MPAPETNKKLIASLIGIIFVGLAIYVQSAFDPQLRELLRSQLGGMAAQADTIANVVRLVLFGLLAFFVVRTFGFLIFGIGYRFRSTRDLTPPQSPAAPDADASGRGTVTMRSEAPAEAPAMAVVANSSEPVSPSVRGACNC